MKKGFAGWIGAAGQESEANHNNLQQGLFTTGPNIFF